jgi:hypothetical protein
MNDNDFLNWRNMDWMGARKRPAPDNASDIPFLRVSNDRYARAASFEDRLTFEDKLFLEAVGIAI